MNKVVCLPLAAVFLSACGGGGGGNNAPPSDLGFMGVHNDSGAGGLDAGPDGGALDAAREATGDGPGDASADATGSDAADALPPVDPQCVQGHTWAAAGEQAAGSIVRFGGVTPTELNLVWTRANGDPVAADRRNATSAFTALAVLLPAPPAGGRPALDSTGTLVLSIDSTGLYPRIWQRSNAQPATLWQLSTAATTPFDAIVHAVGQSISTWSEPAFGASGDRLFYVVTQGLPSIYESSWDSQAQAWTAGVQLPNPDFTGTGPTSRRRPTGASADDRTLFFYDEVSGVERAAWRQSPAAPFDHFEDLPTVPEAAPNLDCSSLYFVGSSPGDGGAGDGGEAGSDAGSDGQSPVASAIFVAQ